MHMKNRQAMRKEREQKMLAENRLPPGQALTMKFPVYHAGVVPQFEPATWDFQIYGEVEDELRCDWLTFNQFPRRKLTLDVHCVTRWSAFDMEWEGVSLGELVRKGIITPTKNARFVIQHCEGGWRTSVPISIALAENFLLATHHQGEPLSPEHGYPLRAVTGRLLDAPQLKTVYLWKGGKWLRKIEFVCTDRLGYWESVGFHNEADVWKEQRFGDVQNTL